MTSGTRAQTAPKAAPALPSGSGLLQRKCACGTKAGSKGECEECRKKQLRRKEQDRERGNRLAVPPIVREVLSSPGQSMDPTARSFFEPRFGHDFSRVRIHTNEQAAASASAVRALAYTVGNDVVFGRGQFAPATDRGRKLFAHELTHVVQQARSGATAAQSAKAISDPSDAAEVEAENVGDRVAGGGFACPAQAPDAAVSTLSELETGLIVGGAVVGAGVGIAALAGVFDSSKYRDCSPEWQKAIEAATATAEQWINNAVSKVDSVLAGGVTAEPYVLEKLYDHFKLRPTAKKELSKVRESFAQIQSGFRGVEFECETKCSETDDTAGAGYVGGLFGQGLIYPKVGRIHLCPAWFKSAPDVRAETIAHEMAHRFGGMRGEAYRNDTKTGAYRAMTPEQAIENADSYAQFAKTVFNIGSLKDGNAKEQSPDQGGKLQKKAADATTRSEVPDSVYNVLSSPGQPLDSGTRNWIEPRFGRDFGNVRLHIDAAAAVSAREAGATAYTVGPHVVFAAGQYEPRTMAGRELLAHELTHVAQQEESASFSHSSVEMGSDPEPEREADRVGKEMAGDTAPGTVRQTTALLSRQQLQRQSEPESEPEPEAVPKPAEQSGGIPVLNPTAGLGGNPPPDDCVEFLWAREYPRILRLDTISVLGFGARPASDKKQDVNRARQMNRSLKQTLLQSCFGFQEVKHPFRVRFYYVESDPRDPVGHAIQTEDAQRNRQLAAAHGASEAPRIAIYVDRSMEVNEDASNAKGLEQRVQAIIKQASTSSAKKGAKTGAIVGGIAGAAVGIGVGIAAGQAVAAGGAGLAASIGAGVVAGSLAGAAVLGIGAGLGALIGSAFGKDRGTGELSKERIKEVRAFMTLLRTTGEVKGDKLTNSDADNLARDAVTLWIDDSSLLPLTVKDRRLVIRVMMDGPTMDDDERAIIRLLENSKDAEVLQILDPTADARERVTVQDLDSEIHGAEWQETKEMLRARFPTLGAPGIQRSPTETEPGCEGEQAIMIVAAKKRATEIVPIALQRINDFLADPDKQQSVRNQIQCFFPGASRADVERIKSVFERIVQLIPSSRYVCPGYKKVPAPIPNGVQTVQCEGSADVAQTVPWIDDGGKWGANRETYLCPTFFEAGPVYQAATVIHEWFHRVVPQSEVEKHVPPCGSLKLATALDNPDSYAYITLALAEGHAADNTGVPVVTVGNFRNTGMVTPENRCLSCPQIPTLGVVPGSGANFMELRGDIVGHRPDALYDFKRTREVAIWKKEGGIWERVKYDPPGTPDDASAADEDVAPKDDKIYTIDGPGPHVPLPSMGDPNIEAGVYRGNFVETVNVKVGQNPWAQSSNAFLWHSTTWFERDTDGLLKRTPGYNEIAPGKILIGESLPYGPGDYELPDPRKGVPV